jgi:uncharacterized protein (DUF58 family)
MAISGRAALLAVLGVIPVGIAPGAGSLFLWLLLLVALVILDLSLAGRPGQLSYERPATLPLRLGESVRLDLIVRNTGSRRVRGVLRDAWQPSTGLTLTRHSVNLPAGGSQRISTPAVPTRRGDRLADRITVRSFGPLGLAARQLSAAVPGKVRVLPPFHSRKHLPSKLAQLRELDGRVAVQIRGAGTEFDSLREYVPGDDVRSIDWRATARRQQVVLRTWRPERDRRVLIVLDTSRTAAGRIADEPRLDANIEAALLLSALASRAGDRVEVLAVDRGIRAQIRGLTGAELLSTTVNALAPIEPELVEADWSLIVGTIRKQQTHRCLVVVLTPLEPAALDAGLFPVLPQLTDRHLVLLAGVTDPGIAALTTDRADSYAVYGAAAAQRDLLDKAGTERELSRYHVNVLQAPPDELAPALADRYLALKAAGRL